ncbi:MAG: hypothetical protein ABI330_19665 [Caldimonas sp.]|nr:hypothetical protein [Pseudomonadota bacterium]
MKFSDFFEAMDAATVEYVLVGGLAVSLQGAIRGTLDVDVALAMDDANLARFIAAARAMGLSPLLPVPIDALADAAQIDRWFREKNMLAFSLREATPAGLVVDVLVRPVVPFTELRSAAVVKMLGSARIPVASVQHLIALKSGTGRSIDELDIAQLRRLHAPSEPPP